MNSISLNGEQHTTIENPHLGSVLDRNLEQVATPESAIKPVGSIEFSRVSAPIAVESVQPQATKVDASFLTQSAPATAVVSAQPKVYTENEPGLQSPAFAGVFNRKAFEQIPNKTFHICLGWKMITTFAFKPR